MRPGNVHSAHGWRDVLEPVVARYRDWKLRRYFQSDAAFASPDIYEFLEAEGYKYAIRLKANAVLQASIAHLLSRPVARPPNHVRRTYDSFSHQAGSWNKKRRVVAKVEWHPGELVPRVGFIVTDLSRPAERVVAFHNQRGTAEQHIKEGKNAILWTRLSCRKFRDNEVRLQLHALAYKLANFMRTLALPKELEHWSLTTLREKLVKIGAKVVSHGPVRHVPACRGGDSTAGARGNPANDRRPAADASTDMTPRVIAAGLNRRGPGAPRLPNGRPRAPECTLTWARMRRVAQPKPPNRDEWPAFRSMLDCATVFGAWDGSSGKSRLKAAT